MKLHLIQGSLAIVLCFSACKSQVSLEDKDLKGKWVVKKAKWYTDGQEIVYFPGRANNELTEVAGRKSDMEAMWGTRVDPAIIEFTNYGEAVIGVESAIEFDRESAIYSYKFEKDTLHFIQNMFPELKKNPVHVYKVGADTLVLARTIAAGESSNKQIFTTYYTR